MSKRVITLGTWEGKSIEWIVLKEEKNQTLVISKIPLFSLELSWVGKENSWIGSSLRKYLNNEFYNSAFNSEEKKMIVNSYLSDPDSTKDDVFLLSCDEADEYMTEDEMTFGVGKCYDGECKNCYKYSERYGTCCFLRTPSGGCMSVMDCLGDIVGEHYDGYGSIRPSLIIREK